MPTDLSRRQIVVIFVGVMLGMMLGAVDGTIVFTALPTIVGEFGGISALPWVGTIYMLTSTVSVPLYGKLSDLYGRRLMFRTSIAVFLVGSMLAGASQNMVQLIAFRGLQGLGGGGLMTMGMAIIAEVISPRERGRYMGYMTPAFFVATVVGPLLGGFLVDQLSWRWIFYINLPLGGLALLVTHNGLRHLPFRRRSAPIDFLGAGLLVGAASSLLLASTWGGQRYAWSSPTILGLGGAVVVLGALFLHQESQAEAPIMPLRLFRLQVFRVVPGVAALMFASLFGVMVFLPLYMQSVKGLSPTQSGLGLLPLVTGMMGMSTITGRLVTRWGRYKVFCVAGLGLAPAPMFVLSQLPIDAPTIVLAGCLVLIGAAMGMVMPVTLLAVQNAVDFEDLGVGTSVVSFIQSLGGTLGLALFGALFNARFVAEVGDRLPNGGRGLDIETLASSPAVIRSLPPTTAEAVIGGVAAAVQTCFLVATPLLVFAFFLALRLVELPLRETSFASSTLMAETMAAEAGVGMAVAEEEEAVS